MTLWTVAHQSPLSLGFSWQEHWRDLPFLSPGNLPDPGIKCCILAGGFCTTEPPGKPTTSWLQTQFRIAHFLKGRTQGWGARWAKECGGKAAEGLVNILQGDCTHLQQQSRGNVMGWRARGSQGHSHGRARARPLPRRGRGWQHCLHPCVWQELGRGADGRFGGPQGGAGGVSSGQAFHPNVPQFSPSC